MSLMNWNVKGISDIPFQHSGRGKQKYARKEKFTRLEARGEGELAKKNGITVSTHSTESRFNRFGTLFAELVRQYDKLVGNKATVPRLRLLESLCI